MIGSAKVSMFHAGSWFWTKTQRLFCIKLLNTALNDVFESNLKLSAAKHDVSSENLLFKCCEK